MVFGSRGDGINIPNGGSAVGNKVIIDGGNSITATGNGLVKDNSVTGVISLNGRIGYLHNDSAGIQAEGGATALGDNIP